jgi:hypothetical protein
MGKTLFIGCSHTMGYYGHKTEGAKIWQDNNYAEIYGKENNKSVIVMASGGTANRAYPNFLAHALKQHDDIEEVFVQSTYWSRFPVAINPTLNEKEILPLDFFIENDLQTDELTRYSLGLCQNKTYLEQYLKPEPFDYKAFPYINAIPFEAEPDVRRLSYMYLRMYHYSQTHLEQQDYIKDITFMDMLCRDKDIPLYVWNINDRCFIPNSVDGFYTNLTQTTFSKVDAINFLQHKTDKSLDCETLDGEHYNYYIHGLIAKDYIPFLKENK